MGSTDLRKTLPLFVLLVSASLLWTSSAGMSHKSTDRSTERIVALPKEALEKFPHGGEKAGRYRRILKVKTNDYGSYDPSPAFVKPPFKAILN